MLTTAPEPFASKCFLNILAHFPTKFIKPFRPPTLVFPQNNKNPRIDDLHLYNATRASMDSPTSTSKLAPSANHDTAQSNFDTLNTVPTAQSSQDIPVCPLHIVCLCFLDSFYFHCCFLWTLFWPTRSHLTRAPLLDNNWSNFLSVFSLQRNLSEVCAAASNILRSKRTTSSCKYEGWFNHACFIWTPCHTASAKTGGIALLDLIKPPNYCSRFLS